MGMSASQARLLSITARMNDVEYKSQNIDNIKIRLADESEQLAMKYTKALNKQKYQLRTWSKGQEQRVDLNINNLWNPDSRYRLQTTSGKMVLSPSLANAYRNQIVGDTTAGGYNGEWMDSYTDSSGHSYDTSESRKNEAMAEFCLQMLTGVPSWNKSGYSYSNADESTRGWNGLIKDFGEDKVNYYKDLFNEMFEASTVSADGKRLSATLQYVEVNASAANDPNWLYEAIASGEFILVDTQTGEEVTASNTVALEEVSDTSDFAKAEAEYNAANMKINNKEKLLDNELKKLDTEHSALNTEMDSLKNLISNNIDKSFNLFS